MSSAPSSLYVDKDEEFRRLKPIFDAVKKAKLYNKTKFSIDSYEPEVITCALKSGFEIVNDITGLSNDEVSKLCASNNAAAVIMHMQGTPQTMQHEPKYDNILSDIYSFLSKELQERSS